VVAFSSGNHAQGVALAAKLLGIPATIVMPSDAPKVKADATAGYGAEVRFYDRLTESREKIAAAIAQERGAVVVPAFDDPQIIAGQGTAGLELVRQAEARGAALDLVISPCSGGGLLAGIATAVKALSPTTVLWGVEPAGYDDTLQSLRAGERRPMTPTHRTLCDALETPCPGELTFPILKAHVADVAVVTDAEVAEAVRYAFSVLKLVVEPGGSAGLAALLAGKVQTDGVQTLGLVLSGGNVDPELFGRILRREP
jgi:threonine dehydratase